MTNLASGAPAVMRERENFPVALAVLPRRIRVRLWAIYRYARYVDTLGDGPLPSGSTSADRRALLTGVAEAVDDLYAGQPVADPVVHALGPVVDACGLPAEPLLDLIRANLMDQDVHRYATFDDLLGYCRLSADPVGELVLHVFGAATPDRLELSARICTGLQLVEHWQDVAEDYAADRIYLPQGDLRRFGVAESDLGGDRADERLRALIAFQTDRALAWMDAGAPLVSTLRGWARLAVSGYVAGGRAAAARLAACRYDPLPDPPKPGGRHIAAAWLAATVRSAG